MFVSDQIGGWLLVVSLEYILIPGDPSRGRRSRSDKWSGHGRYFVLLLLLLSVSLSLFSLPSLLFSFLLFFWFLFTISFPPLFPRSRRREERFGSDLQSIRVLASGPFQFRDVVVERNGGMDRGWSRSLGFFFLGSFLTSFGSFVSCFLVWFSFSIEQISQKDFEVSVEELL